MSYYLSELIKQGVKVRQIYKMLNVNQIHIFKEPNASGYILHTRKNVFKTEYNNYIPIKNLTDEEYESIKTFTYKSKKETPVLHKIRQEVIEYLKETNAIK